MSVPSMVHRSGDSLVVRSVVSGDALFGSGNVLEAAVVDDSDILLEDKDLPECKIKRNYSCATCDYFTQNPRHYLYHLRDVHKEKVKIYECPNCLYASKHFQKLLRHTKMVHGSTNGVEMPDFVRAKGRKRSLPDDVGEEQGGGGVVGGEADSDAEDELTDESNPDKTSFKCPYCSLTARTQALLDKHTKDEHIKTKYFRCTKCTYVTHMKARFTKHVKYHSMPMIKCDLCDFRTPYKWNLDRHCKNHNGKGAFRCSACNFTADIKQSLTVHEMNHHVPPVGQAAGLGVGRRRNKVGASDSTAEELTTQVIQSESSSKVVTVPVDEDNNKKTHKLKIYGKKLKTANNNQEQQHHQQQNSSTRAYGSDFIDPDDIIHHANGNIYIKNKCKLCNFKTAWDSEMAKHEQRVHNIVKNDVKVTKKAQRPIPNLIPIPSQGSSSASSVLKVTRPGFSILKSPDIQMEQMSQKDINDICAKSANSALKDFASLFNSEDVFKDVKSNNNNNNSTESAIPDLIPAKMISSSIKSNIKENLNNSSNSNNNNKRKNNSSFFDKLQEKLNSDEVTNLTCQFCGHESKCLTESAAHQKTCGKEQTHTLHNTSIHNLSSTRCQHCRQRCKSSTDLLNHLQTCEEAFKALQEYNLMKSQDADTKDEPHPMENRVFVWNNIEIPMDVDVDDMQNRYDYVEDKLEDNISLDLSIRTQSPSSENSFTEIVHNNNNNNNNNQPPVTDKIPTHGTDISVAQHKRVFKCPHCSFWASTASRFHVHIVGHLNKKPFECSLCAYRSNWRWDITKHIKLKSVRDPAHEEAKVLMTDETGRRNYTKYNKYLTEIHLSGDHTETSGGSGTRSKNTYDSAPTSQVMPSKTELPKLTKAPSSSDFSPLLRNTTLRPPPALKAADGALLAKISEKKKNNNADSKKTQWKCKKCNFRDASRDKLLEHVKGHYQQSASLSGILNQGTSLQVADNDEASSSGTTTQRGQAPFRCGHCHQVSNWKHVIQRHCRLKHSGDIRVVVGTKNGPEKIELDDQLLLEEPDHIDVPQSGTFKCNTCPFSNNDNDEFEEHLKHHTNLMQDDHNNATAAATSIKCNFCLYYVNRKEDLYEHLKLHGIKEPDDYFNKYIERNCDTDNNKRHKCNSCPYVTNSKSQYQYHKQFHKPRGGQYCCSFCGYNVSKRHLLHQHLKVHGINASPQKSNDTIDLLDDINDDIEEINMTDTTAQQHQLFPDIPLVWVSKHGKFYKMYKCRFCPHVNLRKVNIQEHEKMHGVREKNPNASRGTEVEHHCQECNYVCNNAGVLSSHSKVHQGSSGTIHCLVDNSKTDDEQIRELSRALNINNASDISTILTGDEIEAMDTTTTSAIMDDEGESILYFCDSCPARFLKETEFNIHVGFHGARLYYKCEYCTYTARQKPHLLAHNKVHLDEYQQRTKVLQNVYNISTHHQPPQTCIKTNQNGEFIWVVDEPRDDICDYEIEEVPITTKSYRSNNVPLSGTELFQQKEEALLKHAASDRNMKTMEVAPLHIDPQFGTLVNGNPNFIYPTSLKNGRKKEKRYKCHKCPSAFEKREQYKVHLSLHGAKQRYKCEHCDYAVKYYANYVQHLKKHQMNLEAHAARKLDDDDFDETEAISENNNSYEEKALKNLSTRNVELSTAEKQYLKITQRRLSEPASAAAGVTTMPEERKLFWCPYCPYTNHRKDAVDNHQKRHICVSGSSSNFVCKYCDYTVPQNHFLKEHIKIHFQNNKINQPEGFLNCNNMKLTTKVIMNDAKKKKKKTKKLDEDYDNNVNDDDGNNGDDVKDTLVFRDNGTNDHNRFEPELNTDVLEKLNNNNDGEKILVNASGELIDGKFKEEEEVSIKDIIINNNNNTTATEECTSISQINSDN